MTDNHEEQVPGDALEAADSPEPEEASEETADHTSEEAAKSGEENDAHGDGDADAGEHSAGDGDADHGDGEDHGHGEHGDGHGHGSEPGAALRQLVIVVALVAGMLLLHRFGVTGGRGIDPTAMLALGFVVLASFTIGALVDVIKLPHITGYLFAGAFFGPSVVELLQNGLGVALPAPFDVGVLNRQVIGQLNPLNTLAVALIALTAGGELRIDALKKGLRAITGVLVGQLVTVLVLVTAFFYLVSGVVPALALPELGDIGGAAIPIGLTVAAIAFATSPAATIAVITETGAKGPMSRTVLSAVVLKDVFVVILFGVFSALAMASLGAEGAHGDQSLAMVLSQEIIGSIVIGVVLGGMIALYLRFVGEALLLFIVGVVYTAAFLVSQAKAAHLTLDPVLIFLAAGFVVSNFSRQGTAFIHEVEKLSMPVYVVFFTLAGANLHLDEVWHLLPFAVALVLVRMGAVYLGVLLGGRLGKADEGTQKYGWLGFLSQAGVAITFAGFVGERFGDPGQSIQSLLIAGVALNEVLGPVLLKVGLEWAGETSSQKQTPEEQSDGEPRCFEEWKGTNDSVDWGGGVDSGSEELDGQLHELEAELRQVVRRLSDGPMIELRDDTEKHLRELRREFLRHHRRVVVHARKVTEAEAKLDQDAEDWKEQRKALRQELSQLLRTEQTELAERWRSILLGRGAQLSKRAAWKPDALVLEIDNLVDAVPKQLLVPWDAQSFEPRVEDGFVQSARRSLLRGRRWWAKLFGNELAPRRFAAHDLVRFHLAGEAPPRLEAVATVIIQGHRHLVGRTRNMFDDIVAAYDGFAEECVACDVDLNDQVRRIRDDIEGQMRLALEEAARITRDGSHRTERILARAVRGIKGDVATYCTLDLSERSRRSSKVFRERVRALETLGQNIDKLRRSVGGEYALLAMELELLGLEARVKDLLAEFAGRLAAMTQRRALDQATRAQEALDEALRECDALLGVEAKERSGAELVAMLRLLAENTEKVAAGAARIARELRDELLDERKVAPLLDALGGAAASLTERYLVVAGRLARGEHRLPPPVRRVEVEFREIVVEHVETSVAPRLSRAARRAAERIEPLIAALKETERLVAFNVELATQELELVLDEPVPAETRRLLHEMLSAQVERSASVIAGLRGDANRWPEELAESIEGAVTGALDELRGQLVDGVITRSKLDELRRSAHRRRLAQRFTNLPSAFGELREQLGRALGALIGDARLEVWRRSLGLPVPKTAEVLDGEAFATPQVQAELPLVYRRLFAAESMEAGDVLTGREQAIAQARSALQGERGLAKCVAVVGLDGVGKASVVSAIVRGGGWRSVKRLSLEGPATVEDVEALLKEATEAQLVVLQGLHWMMSAKPGGFEPLRRFVDGVVCSSSAWLLYAEELSWLYASSVAPLSAAFPEAIHLKPLTPDELTAAVMERHRLSGFSHSFDRREGQSSVETWIARGASRIRRPMEQYFHDLHTATGGLVRDALRLWLASIRGVKDDDVVHVGHVPRGGYTALSRLPESVLLTLFQIARQGWMDAPALASLYRTSESEARAELARLEHLGLLERQGHAHRVAIHLRGAVVRVIAERGWMP